MILSPYRFTAGGGSYWNPADKHANVTLSNSDKTATSAAGGWKAVRGITSHNSGKWYAELLNDADGSSNGSLLFGVGTSSATLNSFVGSDASGYGIQANNTTGARTYNGGSSSNAGGPYTVPGERCGVAVDFGAGSIWLSALDSGTWEGGGNPSAGTSPTFTFTPGTALFLMLAVDSTPQQCTLKNNTGENLYTIPTGFSMWA